MFESKQSEAFHAVAELGSFELASKQLFITPSAVTLRVQSLEKELGQLLVIRGKPCVLTKAGQEVFQYLQHTKLLRNTLLQNLQSKSSDNFYKVSVASNADSLATWLLPALKDLLVKEKIVLEIKSDDQTQTYALLESGEVNSAISIEQEPMKGCHSIYLGDMTYILISSPEFKKKWFGQTIQRNQLRHTPVIVFNEKDRMQSDMLMNLYGLPLNSYPSHVIPSPHSFVQAVELGVGYGYAPVMMIKEQLKSGKLVELIPKARNNVALYWHYWKKQSQSMEYITNEIIKNSKRYLDQVNIY